MLKMVAVVIPFYKNTLSEYEKISLQQCEKVLSAYDKIVIKPESLILPSEANIISFSNIVNFADNFFENTAGYNHLMLSTEFYKQFLDYKYVLIYQMDAFVFKDELSDWCNYSFDYIGAPWIKKTYHKTKVGLFLSNTHNYLSRQFDFQKRNFKKTPASK